MNVNPERIYNNHGDQFPPVTLEPESLASISPKLPRNHPRRITDPTLRDRSQDLRFALFPPKVKFRNFDLLHKLDNEAGYVSSIINGTVGCWKSCWNWAINSYRSSPGSGPHQKTSSSSLKILKVRPNRPGFWPPIRIIKWLYEKVHEAFDRTWDKKKEDLLILVLPSLSPWNSLKWPESLKRRSQDGRSF
jgi:hypothetical protein